MSTVSQGQFSVMLAESRSAFRLEHQREPLPGEAEAFGHWLNGNPMVPWEWPPWRDWLDLAWRHVNAGGSIQRVRLVDEPATRYQQWAVSITSWHEQAGERIQYLPCHAAQRLSIPITNWWLFDDAQLVLMSYDGDVPGKILVTDAAEVRRYKEWRDLALRHAKAAEAVAM